LGYTPFTGEVPSHAPVERGGADARYVALYEIGHLSTCSMLV